MAVEEPRPRLIGAGRIAPRIQLVGEQPPAVGRIGLEPQGAAQRRDRIPGAARLAECRPELEVYGGGARLLGGERLEHGECRPCLTRDAVCGAENQPCVGVRRNRLENLARLLPRQTRVTLEQPAGVCERHVDGSNRLGSVRQVRRPLARTPPGAQLCPARP